MSAVHAVRDERIAVGVKVYRLEDGFRVWGKVSQVAARDGMMKVRWPHEESGWMPMGMINLPNWGVE